MALIGHMSARVRRIRKKLCSFAFHVTNAATQCDNVQGLQNSCEGGQLASSESICVFFTRLVDSLRLKGGRTALTLPSRIFPQCSEVGYLMERSDRGKAGFCIRSS